MKKFSLVWFSLLILIIISGSCKKEDPIYNYFTYELIKYEIDEGILEYYGKLDPDDGGYNFDVTLFSTGIVFDPIEVLFSGTGNYIYLELFSASGSDLSEGVYNFDPDGSKDAVTFDIGTFGLFLNMDDETGTAVFVNSGTIEVSLKGSNYKFVFKCKTSAGDSITGSYNGPLQFYDNTD